MQTRKDFIRTIAGGLAFPAMGSANLFASDVWQGKSVKIDNPYAGVKWDRINHIPSTSHIHITTQEMLHAIYNDCGIRHLPISNYYPSAPYYPIHQIRKDQFKVKQEFAVMFSAKDKNGSRLEKGPVYWNDVIMDKNKGWYHKLPEALKEQLPFTEGGRLFTDIPGDLIVSPNAEHHSFINSRLHANSLGSMYSSGTFDQKNQFLTRQHGYSYGTGRSWEEVFTDIISALAFPDGGGITINHPVWSGLKLEEICRMLDFDPKVLGIEVFNDTCAVDFGDPTRGWSLKLWDEILKTGRRCLGFFVPDHTFGRGRNMLLVDHFTEHACLAAYQKGAFYGAIHGSGLRFNKISLQENVLTAETNKRSTIRLITNLGEVHKERAVEKVSFEIPLNTDGSQDILYIRVEANDDSSELIYSQPIRFLAGLI